MFKVQFDKKIKENFSTNDFSQYFYQFPVNTDV